MTRHISRVWLAVGSALMLALICLAWMQYRWITRVADAERERLEVYVNRGTQQLSDEFDREIARTLRALLSGPPELSAFTDRCIQFHEFHQNEARLVRGIYAVSDQRFYSYDPSRKRMVEGEWPPQLLNLREHLDGGRPRRAPIVDPAVPAVMMRRSRMPQGRPPRMDDGPPEGQAGAPRHSRGPDGDPPREWAIIEFDRDYIRNTWLPELAARFLRTDTNRDFTVRVIAANDPAVPVFQVNAEGVSFASPEATAPLFSGRALSQGGFGPPGPPAPPGGWAPTTWRIEAKHRSGSLENAVEQTRRANLAISGATMLLMAAALAVILISTRRAQALAFEQMEFVAGVSHELRTPMAVICSAADNLADGVVTNEKSVKRYGSLIRTESRRLASMVDQILRFAGIQSGRVRYELQPVKVETVVAAALDACAEAIEKTGCTVERAIPADLPDVQADPTALIQAIRNLVENAAIHAGTGRWIGVSAVARDAGVEITVADHGPGIPGADLKRIFDPFYRGQRALDDQIHGFGLGLALVKRIAEAHSGSVRVETDSSGTRFHLTIAKVHA